MGAPWLPIVISAGTSPTGAQFPLEIRLRRHSLNGNFGGVKVASKPPFFVP